MEGVVKVFVLEGFCFVSFWRGYGCGALMELGGDQIVLVVVSPCGNQIAYCFFFGLCK